MEESGSFKCPKCNAMNAGPAGFYVMWDKKIIENKEMYRVWSDLDYTEPPPFKTVKEINKAMGNFYCYNCRFNPHSFTEFIPKDMKKK